MTDATTEKPPYFLTLQAAYGGPSNTGFGSAAFYEILRGDATFLVFLLD